MMLEYLYYPEVAHYSTAPDLAPRGSRPSTRCCSHGESSPSKRLCRGGDLSSSLHRPPAPVRRSCCYSASEEMLFNSLALELLSWALHAGRGQLATSSAKSLRTSKLTSFSAFLQQRL